VIRKRSETQDALVAERKQKEREAAKQEAFLELAREEVHGAQKRVLGKK